MWNQAQICCLTHVAAICLTKCSHVINETDKFDTWLYHTGKSNVWLTDSSAKDASYQHFWHLVGDILQHCEPVNHLLGAELGCNFVSWWATVVCRHISAFSDKPYSCKGSRIEHISPLLYPGAVDDQRQLLLKTTLRKKMKKRRRNRRTSQHRRVARKQQGEEDELKKKKQTNDGGQKKTAASTLTSWRSDVRKKKKWTLNFLNFSYADAPTVTQIHTLAYTTRTLHQYICIISCGLLHCVALWWCSPH